MRIIFCILPLFFFFLISCEDNADAVKVDESQNKNSDQKITVKAIENFKYVDYALSSEAEQAVRDWEKYQELAIQIDYLKKADLSFFNGDKELIDEFILELKEGIPQDLNTNPIQSRVIIVETKLLKLYDNLTLANITTDVQLNSIEETLEAFSNLNRHINKKMEFDIYSKIQPE